MSDYHSITNHKVVVYIPNIMVTLSITPQGFKYFKILQIPWQEKAKNVRIGEDSSNIFQDYRDLLELMSLRCPHKRYS